ncbi:D-glycerate dehydrogenase [Rhodoplanes sp. TEM]|uniref:D-glycerate dehydrogenase n=1 Tax=Rhodoplanes tepidamans TaxID=200616 RepID=A0ABT5JIE7_RHOTP|nr:MULTISPECIES: D-glycerate dehydrogenase [Rhodoplanes]MDC7788795.1 D-glycerate dehydrogenase [Rhodoplanes tepidamans]MDC7984127.1 D-glycerate dehydrogenase [Rhodoplanes sp. TEM]MDQ0356893.1 glyoxylate reductase [Rhodoplanes tepidamans]
MRPRIFVTQPIAPAAVEMMREVADVEVHPDATAPIAKATMIEGVKRADVLFCLLHDKVDADVVAANPNLKGIAWMGIHPQLIDIKEMERRGIPLTNIPPMVSEATADMAMALILACARRVLEGDRLVRAGIYPGGQSNYMLGLGVTGKTIGLIGGGGRIGKLVARRCSGFDMRVLYSTPRRKPEAEEREWGLTWAPLDDLLRQSDFVSMHSPLREDTYHSIGEREFALMKPTAYFVNTSRGPIVDEAALVRALQTGTIAGAGLDVFEHEPQVPAELLSMSNVVLTPHLGSAVADLRAEMARIVAVNAIALVQGKAPPNLFDFAGPTT